MTAPTPSTEMDFDDSYPILAAMRRSHPLKVRRWKRAHRRYRTFADRRVRPIALEVDRRSRQDHDHLNGEFCRQAAREKMLSVTIPPLFGGQGGDMIELAILLEELCAACTGLGNVIGAHYLGYAGLGAGLHVDLLARISREIVDGEARGEPVLVSFAITEPAAGSDVQDEELLKRARVGTTARRVEGGFLLNGQKVFISDGHLAAWHVTTAYRDRNDPLRSAVGMMVRTGMEGLSIPKHELKMGQGACPASVLQFDDCFVPDALVLSDPEDGVSFMERVLFVLGTSRVGVSAIGTGCARGALERAVATAGTEQCKGRRLIEEQWVQQILAEMLCNVMAARALTLQAAIAEADQGLISLMVNPVFDPLQRMIPQVFLDSPLFQKTFRSRAMSSVLRHRMRKIDLRCRQRVQGTSSAAKVKATDLAMTNANLALEIAGAAGLEQSSGVEKFFRDAKLLQIYEGTNQINRKHVFDTLIARSTTL